MPNTNQTAEAPSGRQGLVQSAFQGISLCASNPEMTDSALGKFVRFAIAGVRALSGQPDTPGTTGANEADGATSRGRRTAAGKRGRTVGATPLKDMVYAWMAERGQAIRRPEIISHFEGQGYKTSSIAGALNDLKKGGLANSQNGLWEVIPQTDQQTTSHHPEQAAETQALRTGT